MGTFSYIVISLVLSAFFSGMEIAFVSSDKLRYEVGREGRSLANKILDFFYNNPSQFISTMLVGNNIALVVYGIQMSIVLEPVIKILVQNTSVVLFCQSVISTLLILFFGEFIPKTIFKLNANFSLKIFSFPLFLFFIILYPISVFSSFVSSLVLRLFGIKNLKIKGYRFGKVDLDFFLQQSIEDSSSKSSMDTEVKMFQNALDFSNVRIRNCVVPRTEIVACEKTLPIDELRLMFIESGLSKILVYEGSLDNIIGYIHSSELFKSPSDWTQKIRSVSIVPENMPAHKLMKLMMQKKKNIAVVVDEFGGTSGIVSLEDLVEEIFGEIEDEHDNRSEIAQQVSSNEYLLSGRMEISAINEKFNLHLPESDDYITIAGFILHENQGFPKVNETIEINTFSFKIIRVSATRIELVRVKINNL